MIKSYQGLMLLPTFEERFDYLKLYGSVGHPTFGLDRYLNQTLYHSRNWKFIRRDVIVRDKACDLAISDREIFGGIRVHHINPITVEDIELGNDCVFDINNLICTSHDTHNAIHYGDASKLPTLPTERKKGDTCPWKVF